MIVPDYWAEARRQVRETDRQVTVRRFGWSVSSEADAIAMAERRADEAMQRILAGERLNRREPKVPYNGADGVPIREEVVARHGEHVITRNAYGARCLNSPNVLIADIDFVFDLTFPQIVLVYLFLACISVILGVVTHRMGITLGLLIVSLFLVAPFATLIHRVMMALQGGAETASRRKIVRFLARHPQWSTRLYRTFAGYRLLVTHQHFDARTDDVRQFFRAVVADRLYVRMCINQRCFRARLTAKPWRIGIESHMRPRPGVWPVRPERMSTRSAWIATYEAQAASYAACRYIESLGSGIVHESIRPIVELHDHESGALMETALLA